MKSTFMANAGNITRKWYIVDAEGLTLGRLAASVAKVLTGKNKPTYTPHVDTGDNVIVINADKVVLTGKKELKKVYSTTPVTSAEIDTRKPGTLFVKNQLGLLNMLFAACFRRTNLALRCIVSFMFMLVQNIRTQLRNLKN